MVRGIRFKIPNDYGKYIGDILSKIDIIHCVLGYVDLCGIQNLE